MFDVKPKPTPTAVKKNQIAFLTTPEEFDAITEMAEEVGLGKSNFLKLCVKTYMEQKDN